MGIALIFLLTILLPKNSDFLIDNTDPKARALLDNLSQNYDQHSSLEFNFTMTLEFENRDTDHQKGKLIQSGKQYLLEMRDQTIMSNGKIVWVYLRNNNEVQIDNVEEDEDELIGFSPKNLLKYFNSDEFEYQIAGSEKQNGLKLTHMEFKPLSSDSDYVKMRLLVHEKTLEIKSIKLFSRDGSRYTIEIMEVSYNKQFSNSAFTFNPEKFPGAYIEDLRID